MANEDNKRFLKDSIVRFLCLLTSPATVLSKNNPQPLFTL